MVLTLGTLGHLLGPAAPPLSEFILKPQDDRCLNEFLYVVRKHNAQPNEKKQLTILEF